MSAPDTNLKTQRRQHFWPLLGSALVTIFAVALIGYWLIDESAEAPGPNPDQTEGTELPQGGGAGG